MELAQHETNASAILLLDSQGREKFNQNLITSGMRLRPETSLHLPFPQRERRKTVPYGTTTDVITFGVNTHSSSNTNVFLALSLPNIPFSQTSELDENLWFRAQRLYTAVVKSERSRSSSSHFRT